MKNQKSNRNKIWLYLLIILVLLYLFSNQFNLFDKNHQATEINGKNNIEVQMDENKAYYSKEDVALYIHSYKKLPPNYLTKDQARSLGWDSSEGNLWDVTEKGVIGGDRFWNREGQLPEDKAYFEADVNYDGGFRGPERLVYTENGEVIYYTQDHYESFERLY